MNGALNLKEWKTKLSKTWKGDKKVKILLILGLVGMLLILFSEVLPEKSNKSKETPGQVITAAEYCDILENRMTKLVSSISGAGKCEVLITLENGVEYIYMTDIKTSNEKTEDEKEGGDNKIQEKSNNEEKVIIIDGKDGEEGLLSKEVEPKVRGVVVVCEGGGDIMVTQRVVNAVTTALNISTARVYVTQLEPDASP